MNGPTTPVFIGASAAAATHAAGHNTASSAASKERPGQCGASGLGGYEIRNNMACAPSNIGRHRKVLFASFVSKLAEMQASHFDVRCANGHGNGSDESSPRQAQFGSEVASNSLDKLHATASSVEQSAACGFHTSVLTDRLLIGGRSSAFFMPITKSQGFTRTVQKPN
jgi:hypothetical protein